MSSAHSRTIKQIKLNPETRDITLLFQGQSTAIEAKALEFHTDEAGSILYLLLDRLVHKPHETEFNCFIDNEWQTAFSISGCVVSEFSRESSGVVNKQ